MSSSFLCWLDGLVLARADAFTSDATLGGALGAPIVLSVECAANLEAPERA